MNANDDEGDDECDGCELSAAVSGLGDVEASGRRPVNNMSAREKSPTRQKLEMR
jgi:hypothetical protein